MRPTDKALWWRGWRIAGALAVALAVAALTFVIRFNSLSGSFGGLDDDHFATLMRVDLLLEGERPLRDFADYELRGAWPSLSYLLPAWAQQLGGRSLLSEAYLTIGAIAFSTALLFIMALDFSKRWTAALVAAAFTVATMPKLYNYPKVLMLALGVLAISAVARFPSWQRLALAAAVTAAAVLFRHDYGAFLAIGVLTAVVAYGGGWRSVTTRVGTYVGVIAVLLIPSAVWIQAYAGFSTYVRRVAETAMLEAQRTELRLPRVGTAATDGGDAMVFLTYCAFWLVAAGAGIVLEMRRRAAAHLSRTDRATAAGLLATVVTVNLLFLRANLTQRFGDAAIPVALLAAWTVGSLQALPIGRTRWIAGVTSWALLGVLFGASVLAGDTLHRLRESGLMEGRSAAEMRFMDVRDRLRQLPPDDWFDIELGGTLPAARYVAQCTSPGDRLLFLGYAPEIAVMARRGFAAGQSTVSLGFYRSDEDQERALARLAEQSVPVVLAAAGDFEESFVSDYPLLAAYLFDHYRDAGSIALEGEADIRVFVDATRTPARVDPHFGLPCFQ